MTRATIEALIRILAEAEGLDPELCARQCQAESNWNPAARSRVGAIGLFQLMPATARELGVDPARWHENVFGGVRYLARLARKYNGDMARALAAYNWGMGNVDRATAAAGDQWQTRLPKETRDYLARILPPTRPTPAKET